MESYAYFQMPQHVHYGRGSFEKLGEEAQEKGKKALIISDSVMDQIGNVSACRDLLKKENMDSETYLGVESEPTDQYVDEALTLFKAKQCDVIVSIGGGSCMDTAKAVSVLAANGGYIGDYMGGRKIAATAPVPHIAIPTTAGTGSEATDVTVIDNTSTHVKMMIKQPAFLPHAAIVDPLMSKTSPKKVTASTGVDALSHAIESYISRISHPMTDMMALSAMKRITANLFDAYESGDNITARENMALGALQAGIAFSNASVCLVHGMSRPIGALFNIPHGFSNAMLLPAVLESSKDSCVHRLADLGRIFATEAGSMSDEAAADVAVDSVKKLCTMLHIPNLKTWGIDQDSFEESIPQMAEDAIDSGSPGNNPWSPTKKEIETLYRVCYNYSFETVKG